MNFKAVSTPLTSNQGAVDLYRDRYGPAWLLLVFLLLGHATLRAEDNRSTPSSPEDLQFFESKVRPLLIEHCHECHSEKAQKGELRLDVRDGVFNGGESGPAVIAGDADLSLLVQAVKYDGLEMPPKGKLPDDKIDLLVQWVRRGAAWPAEDSTHAMQQRKHSGVMDEDRQHWSFLPVRATTLPAGAASNPIDHFIDDRLASEGLTANGSASASALVRRAFFGLTGLPPTYEELETWVGRLAGEDQRELNQAAYGELIDELLNRPSYGEHWARHWLDVVRFAQSNGYERDGYKPDSWRYRDYVVKSFFEDKPYDRFVLEQLAGDELPDSDADSRTATGFYRMGVWDDEPDDKRQAEFDELDDVMVTIGASFMGLTIGCARCHEHKFDPIPQADYYRLLAFLRNVRRYENPGTTLQNATALPVSDETDIRKSQLAFLERKSARDKAIADAETSEERKKIESQPLDENLSGLQWALGVRENDADPPPTHVLIRGNAGSPGQEVMPGFLQVLSPSQPESNTDALGEGTFRSESPLNDLMPSSGRRLALARWLTDPIHPLTARVMVNRVWHYHFGRGIVATTGDFGTTGDPPSHPELLDWLADDFVKHGWSIKRLHRMILTSKAYQRSSQIDAQQPDHQVALEKDPNNRWLWRSSLRRLDAEAIRDRMLASSGELNREVGGREMYPQLSGEVLAGQSKPGLGWEPSSDQQRARRSLYAVVKRSVRDPLLEAFDYSNDTSPLTERPVTTVAPQALMMLHGRFTAERAQHLAQRIAKQSSDRSERVREAFREILQRTPSESELNISLAMLDDFEQDQRQHIDRISFRPDVPVSLFGGYRNVLAGEDFLVGPAETWTYFSGQWGGGYEGIDVVQPRLGPFALWNGMECGDGVLQGRLRVDRAVEYLTLIGRGMPKDSAWQGVGITFDRQRDTVDGRDRTSDTESVVEAAWHLPSETWVPFRWELTEGRSRLWIGEGNAVAGDDAAPVIDQPLQASAAGRIGVAVWGGQVEFDGLQWIPVNDPSLPAIDLARSRTIVETSSMPTGWSRYEGDWRREGDGSWHVGKHHGAKIIWDDAPIRTGVVSVEMQMTANQAQIGGLLVSVSDPKVGADNWFGYEISLNAENQTVFVGDHRNNYRLLKAAPAKVMVDHWHVLRVVLEETKMSVFVDDASQPAIELDLNDRLTGQMVGLRTWGSDVHFRNVTVESSSGIQVADWPAHSVRTLPDRDEADWIQTQSLAGLCRTLFNLSEFLYVE